ncbi:MAG: VWA domain-containing protein [Polyangiaceae bacterium]|nr:VWA domain-containing protein [Polyangiaceae bacterium]
MATEPRADSGSDGSRTAAGGGRMFSNDASLTSQPGECASFASAGEPRFEGTADVIWTLDDSGSMNEEIEAVRSRMREFFSSIIRAGIDVRIALVTEDVQTYFPEVCQEITCVEYPVSSRNSLDAFIATRYDWRSILRPNADKFFVVVSDDESGLPAQSFRAWADTYYVDEWRLAGIFCLPERVGGMYGYNCSGAGDVYFNLAINSGGVTADLGVPLLDWSEIFDELARGVIDTGVAVPCQWGIPSGSEDGDFEVSEVNVEFTDDSGEVIRLFNVPDDSRCEEAGGGWFYDSADAPTALMACPSTCESIQSDNSGQIAVVFGCPTEIAPLC